MKDFNEFNDSTIVRVGNLNGEPYFSVKLDMTEVILNDEQIQDLVNGINHYRAVKLMVSLDKEDKIPLDDMLTVPKEDTNNE